MASDGGAGSRYQAKREIRSFWYPTWLAQPAALVPNSKLIDAPPARIGMAPVLAAAREHELAVIHTSTPSFASDVKVAQAMKDANPALKIGFVGAKVAVQPTESLQQGLPIDFVARNEFDFTIKEVAEGRAFKDVDGISYRADDGKLVHNRDRAMIEDMDSLPFVTDVYKRDLRIEDYFIGYLMHPYISIYTGRGCKSRCTFCLWPQTVGGHRYRTRSPGHVAEEIRQAKAAFPQVREFFFDDDTFTDDLPRAEAIARELGKLGVTWSCNAKANVPRETLKVLKDNGLRLLLVGYESGNQQILHNIKKGMLIDVAKRFTRDCHDLGIKIHGTFILGLPGETKETIEQTIPLRHRDQPAHDAGLPGRTLSGHLPVQAGGGERLAGCGARGAGGRARDPDRAAHLSPSLAYRDVRERRDVLSPVLLPGAEDRLDRRRDGPQPADDEAPAPRGRGILPIPARAARGGLNPAVPVPRRVILSADDFGLSLAVNEAIEQAHRTGVLSTASLMVAGPAAADAVRRARTMPGLHVGLHLVVIEGPAMSPSPIAPDGSFPSDQLRLGVDYFFRPRVRQQLRAEIAAQFAAFAATGLRLDHANAHKHMHLHPTVGRLMIEEGQPRGLRAIRIPSEPPDVLRQCGERPGMGARALYQWSRLLRRQARRAGLVTNDHVFGLAWRWPYDHGTRGDIAAPDAAGSERNLFPPGDGSRRHDPRRHAGLRAPGGIGRSHRARRKKRTGRR